VTGRTTTFSFHDRFDIDADVMEYQYDRDCAATLVDLSETVGQPLALDKVTLPHDGHGRQPVYRKFFRCPVAFGSTPARIELATRLLETHLPIQEVASLLGCSDPGNFTHAFKRWAGKSPSDFRLARRPTGSAGRSST